MIIDYYCELDKLIKEYYIPCEILYGADNKAEKLWSDIVTSIASDNGVSQSLRTELEKNKRSRRRKRYSVDKQVSTVFYLEIIVSAIGKFSISYEEANKLMNKMGLYQLFKEQPDVTCCGAHEGVAPVLKEMEIVIKESGLC